MVVGGQSMLHQSCAGHIMPSDGSRQARGRGGEDEKLSNEPLSSPPPLASPSPPPFSSSSVHPSHASSSAPSHHVDPSKCVFHRPRRNTSGW